MENWESEFLQMFAFVVLTACLFQKGSAESKSLDERSLLIGILESLGIRSRHRGRFAKRIYPKALRTLLSIAFFLLFLMSFILHAAGGSGEFSEQQMEHGVPLYVSTFQYLATSRFWFESLQNWQSEFLAVGAMVVLSIFLRQRGSPNLNP